VILQELLFLRYPDPTTNYISQIDFKNKFVIAEVYMNNKNNLSSGIMGNHYIQILGAKGNNINFWSWGSDKYSSKVGNYLNGVHDLFIINKK